MPGPGEPRRPVVDQNHALDTEVLTALRRLIRAADLDAKQIARQTGLTTSQLVVLELLRDRGEMNIGAIADAVGLTQGTVTNMIVRLERRGLVARRRGAKDRRQVKTRLVFEGEQLLADAPTLLQTRFLRQFQRLPDWEKHGILSSLMRLAELMDVAELDASPVLDVGSIDTAPNT